MNVINGGLKRLIDHYLQADDGSIALFLGAGVNLPCGDVRVRYKTYTWGSLLKALCSKNQHLLPHTFQELSSKFENNWIAIADLLYERVGEDPLIEQIDQLFYSDIPRGDSLYRRLSKKFWDQAPTLQAAVAFCSEIKPKTPEKSSWRFKRNRKIGKVITTNYDFFFGAGWTRYEGFYDHWKVDTPFSSKDPNEDQAPIEYIHGYLPYIKEKEKKSETRGLVLSQGSYDKYYQEGEFAAKSLRAAISNYSLIFVGLSLTDPPLIKMLKEISHGDRPPHFAIVPQGEVENAAELGVNPIEINEFSQIKDTLKTVYCSGITPEDCEHYGFEHAQQYWDRLLIGKIKK
jgi:hypothetical protein